MSETTLKQVWTAKTKAKICEQRKINMCIEPVRYGSRAGVSHMGRISLVVLGPLNRRKTQIIFLNDARVQRVEIEQQNVGIVKTFFRLQHQATCVARLGAFAGVAADFVVSVGVVIIISVVVLVEALAGLLAW